MAIGKAMAYNGKPEPKMMKKEKVLGYQS